MKKFIVLSLFGLLIMAFSATAYAQVEFKAYGALYAGTIWDRNFAGQAGSIASYFASPWGPADHGGWDKPTAYYSSYANIFFEWDSGKEIKGVFNIETCNYFSGRNTAPWHTGGVGEGAEFDTGLWDTRVGETRLRGAYTQFGVPYFGIPVPMSITAGIFGMAVRPPFLFANTNGAGVQIDAKYDPAAFTFTWGKMYEGETYASDDSNWYSLEGRVKAGNVTVGGYVINNNMNTYPIPANYSDVVSATNPLDNANIWWLGGYADGKAGPFNFNFDIAFDTGKVRDNAGVFDDVKYSGFASQLRITYPWEKFTFGGLAGYWSGADLKKTDRNGIPGKPTAYDGSGTSSKVNAFVYPAGDVEWVIWSESMFLGGTWASLICIPQGLTGANWNYQLSRGPTGGTWIAKLFGSYMVTPNYKMTLQGLYIGDTTKNGNTMGNAVNSDGTARDDKTIGWELALINDINIYKSLNLKIGVGMLFAGNALDQNVPGTNTNQSPKNPYMVSSVLTYNF